MATPIYQKDHGTAKGPVQLGYDSGKVVVTPENQDRFVVAAQAAVSACQSAVAHSKIAELFGNEFLSPLHAWCVDHAGRVERCYVPSERCGNFIKVFVVNRAKRFDFPLNEAIAALERQLIDTGWPCDILQLSAASRDELLAFFDPDESLQVYGDAYAQQHEEKAKHHLRFLVHISDEYPDWLANVAFYAAVELIESLLAAEHSYHSRSHEDRNYAVAKQYPRIAASFEAFYNASLDARYEAKEHALPVAEVRRELINRHLDHIRKFVESRRKRPADEPKRP